MRRWFAARPMGAQRPRQPAALAIPVAARREEQIALRRMLRR